MKTLYFDCQAGVSGDMTVGALLDLGVPLDVLDSELSKLSLPIDSYRLSLERTKRHGISALNFDVVLHDHHTHRHFADILAIISSSTLSDNVKSRAERIFRRLAEAEATVHGVSVEEVHFHEVGAVDSIVDIIGVAICLDYLGIEHVSSSSLPFCSGFVQCEHGRIPLPAPATAELMKGVPFHPASGSGERVTPTGAAIVVALAESFGAPLAMKIDKIGYGAGSKDFADIPNILRLFLGEAGSERLDGEMVVIETNIDDSTPEMLGYAMERLLAEGAADVWFTPIQMKKCRPAVMLSIITSQEKADSLSRIVFEETTAIGIRSYPVSRTVLERRVEVRETTFGRVRFKVNEFGEKPEFDDCRRVAAETGKPLRDIMTILSREFR
ncbi:MAG: nickel pincer cofactor biosynthesis protein LarC [Geobacteraceae bacterium]|nr:nickel pincer cofactor biosynthesis protein LarC [Geobacteraceae bacterium]